MALDDVRLTPVGAPFDVGGTPMATRMVGGFILVALLFCILLAWPGRRRWPIWLIAGLSGSVSATLAVTLVDATGRLPWLRLAALAVAAAFCTTAVVRDLKDPLR